MLKQWLQKRVTVAEAEATHMVHTDRLGPDPIPFVFLNQSWSALLVEMQEGDELWEFCSSEESWAHLAGQEGIALLHNGEVVACITTTVN